MPFSAVIGIAAIVATQAEPPATVDAVAALAAEVRRMEPTEVGAWARADPRISALDAPARARRLASVAEGTKWWAPLLNLYPGVGAGSLASRDPRGAWLTLSDGVAFVTMSVGFMLAVGESPHASDAEVARRKRVGRALAYGGLAGLGASRVAGVILPFTFRGRAHRELEQAFADVPPPARLGAFVAPLPPGSGAGAAAGIAVAY
jgi:hypothetical protein